MSPQGWIPLRRRARLAYELGRLRLALAWGGSAWVIQVGLAGGVVDLQAGAIGLVATALVWWGRQGTAAVRYGVAGAVVFNLFPRLALAGPACLLSGCRWWCLGAIGIAAAAAAGLIVLGARRRPRPAFLLAAVGLVIASVRAD